MKILAITDRFNIHKETTNGIRVAKAFASLGHSVKVAAHDVLFEDDIQSADLIITFGTMLYPENLHQFKFIADMKQKYTPFVLWFFDACNPSFKHGHRKFCNLMNALPHVDWFFGTDHSYPFENHAKNFYHLMQGIDPDDFQKAPFPHEPRAYQVIYTGGNGKHFQERMQMLDMIRRNFSLIMYGMHGKRVCGSDFCRAYQNARVAFVPKPPPVVANQYWSNRVYLATATGTPCVVGAVPGIERHFTNEEVLFFRNETDLKQCITALLFDPAYREKVGNAGRARTFKDHTYQNRCRELINVIERAK